MKYIKTLKIDIDKKNFEVIPSVQYDSNTRFLHIQLLNDSVPFDITGCSVILSGVKEDGNPIFNSCDIINSEIGFIQAEVTEQMNAIPGYIDCEIKIYNVEGVLTSKKFTIKVTASQTSKVVESAGEFTALTKALSKVTNINNKRDKSVKITKEDMDTSSNAKKLGLVNLADEVHAAMAGNAEVNPIIPEGSITTEKYADGSITKSKVEQGVYAEASNYIFSVIEQGAYDVIERKSNVVTQTGDTPIFNDNGTFTLEAGKWRAYFIHLRNDLVANKPFSIKMPVSALPEKATIITRWRNSDGYNNVKHTLSVVNGMAMVSNVSYPEEATIIELLIDNRAGDSDLTYSTPSVITSGIPFTTSSITLQDVEDSINIKNHIVGGDGSLTLAEMSLKKPANCTEIRAISSAINTNPDKGITINNHKVDGYLFFYYTTTHGLEAGKVISIGMDIVEESVTAFCEIKFYNGSTLLGSTISIPRSGDRFVKTGIYVPETATRFELRIDNRNEKGTELTLNNIKIVEGGQVDGIKIPYPEVNFNSAKVSLNLFPDPDCTSTSWINYVLGSPIYSLVENGVRFEGNTGSTKCIGYETSKGFVAGATMPYTIYISDFAKADTSSNEFDFNIICYDSANKELARTTRTVSKIGEYSGSLNLPETTALVRFRCDIAGEGNYYTISNVQLGGKKVSLSNMLTRDDIQGLSSGGGGTVMFISPTGNDDNNGSHGSPKATVDNALSNGADDIRLLGGVYEQTINLTLCKHKKLSISRYDFNKEVLFLDPARLVCDTEILVNGYTKVYKADITASFNANNTWIFQDGIPDATTLITDIERHPLQRGYEYRCSDTKIQKCNAKTLGEALQEIESNSVYKWYAEDGVLYFSRPSDVNSVNPICYSAGRSLFATNTGIELKVSGIDTKYLTFNVNNTINSEITNCKASNVFSAGAFIYNSALNTKFIKCEAVRCFNGSNGDGFNGHASNTGDIYSKQMSTLFIDCWSHDNNDDGWSDHERSETTFIGGLFEYNKKGGITPSYGNHCTCYDVLSRQNYCGFNYVGNTDSAEGGMYGQMICYNCVAENNVHGGEKAGFSVSGTKNTLKLINCKSLNNSVGYKASSSNNTVELIDCGSYQDTATKGGSGTFIIKNTTLVV